MNMRNDGGLSVMMDDVRGKWSVCFRTSPLICQNSCCASCHWERKTGGDRSQETCDVSPGATSDTATSCSATKPVVPLKVLPKRKHQQTLLVVTSPKNMMQWKELIY